MAQTLYDTAKEGFQTQQDVEQDLERPNKNRFLTLQQPFSSCWMTVMVAIGTGVSLGVWGGLLLGLLGVHILHCLENLIQMPNNLSLIRNIVAASVGTYCNYAVVLSSTVGIFFGVASFSGVIIRLKREGAAGKAEASAGPFGLIFVTVTGGTLATMLFRDALFVCEVYGSQIIVCLSVFFLACMVVFPLFQRSVIDKVNKNTCRLIWGNVCIVWVLTSLGFIPEVGHSRAASMILITVMSEFLAFRLQDCVNLAFLGTSVSMIVFITESLVVVMRPAVTLETAASGLNKVTVFLFYTVLTSQLIMAAVGMSLFVSWKSIEATKTCATAVSCGGAVLAAVKYLLPLGPGPSIGAGMGVAGAVGVCLTAATTTAEGYGPGGRVGVTVGAAAGAFVSSCAHSGLSGVFMALCAAAIPLVHHCTLIILQIYKAQTSSATFIVIIFIIVFVLWVIVESDLYI